MARDLRPLFDPRSVAIVGASDDPAKWGNWLGRGALRGEHRRPVYLVNRNGGSVLGRTAYASLLDVPEPPELVVVAVPAAAFEQTVGDALSAGASAIVGITAGLGELGADAQVRERELVERVRAAGAMLLGPNCLGVFDAGSDLGLASNEFPPGSIGLVSQSGNLALELGILARRCGLGFSRFASVGNQADLDLAELVAAFAAHPGTDLIAVYAEDFRDGRAFVDAVAAAATPVVLLTVGRTEASARAAVSHTGALVSDMAVVEAACRAAGAHLVTTPGAMIDLAQALLRAPALAGPRVAVVGDGGGHGAIACDVAATAGLELPPLSAGLATALAEMLPHTAATRNPVDLAGGGEQDFNSYARVTRALLESGEIDGVLVTGYFGGYSQYSDEFAGLEVEVARDVARAAAGARRPVVAHTMYAESATADALRAGGVPVYAAIESAAAASELGFPIVLKALGMVHKSDAGGVVVGIASESELAAAVADLEARLHPLAYSVERMAPLDDGVELIVGARRDPRFGPVAAVGIGGLFTEVFADVAVGLAPIDQAEVERMLGSLRGAALLRGVRGRPACDVAAAARAAVALSRVAAARPDIAEIEINPLLVTPAGAVALDARVIPTTEGAADAG